jgi:hypothetical protein
MSSEVGGLDSTRLLEQVAGVVEQSEMPLGELKVRFLPGVQGAPS